ncbi:hypothetical protein NITHO_4930006 [Nitrolancea hollandica Lb]|uniref:Uncharacterized protein n=2 Tax=Nitrolancea hollandica TaxID=1206749 RepID=I4EL52_9BACT|nr:hypothetical protein NITHO_4930006 [Nitrolancea hollandica Lb]
METSARMAAWSQKASDHLQQQFMPRFTEEVKRRAFNLGLDSKVTKQILADIEKSGGDLSAEAVAATIKTAGGPDDLATDLSLLWGRGLDEASEIGEEAATRIHFDYGDERAIEAKLHLRAWFPFHTWATRNIPFYLQTLAENPWLLRTWVHYQTLTDQEKERLGLTDRVSGKLPMPGGDALLGALLGPGTVYFNPMTVMSIADQFKPIYDDPEMPLAGRVIKQAGRVGFSPVPWIDIPLHIAGVYGEESEPGNVLRHSALVKDLTGVDPEGFLKSGVRAVRGQEAPVSGSRIEDGMIRRRIAELSVEETGRAGDPNYLMAMGDPNSEIWQRAASDVRKNRTAMDLLGFVSPFPSTFVGETEQAIRGQAKANEGLDFRQLAQAGNIGTAYSNTSSPERAQIAAGFAMQDQLHPIWGAQKRADMMAQLPFFAQYLAWLQTQPPGADTSIDAFINTQL